MSLEKLAELKAQWKREAEERDAQWRTKFYAFCDQQGISPFEFYLTGAELREYGQEDIP